MTEQQVKRNIKLYYLSCVIFGTYFQQAIWFVYQSQVMHMNFEQIALYASISVIVELIMQVPTGAFADVFGRKIALSIGNLLYALPMFLIAIWPIPEIMLLYSIVWGTARAFSSGPDQAIMFDSLKAVNQEYKFPKINSYAVLSFQISAAISILLGSYLYQVSTSLPYFVSGFASLIGVFTSFLFIEQRFQTQQSGFKIKPFLRTNWIGIKEIFKNSYITKLSLLFIFINGISSPSQKFFIQPYMVEIGMNDIERGWIATIVKIVITLIGVWFVSKKKLFEHKGIIFLLPIVMIISLIPAKFTVYPFTYLIIFGIAFISGNTGMFMTPMLIKHIDSKVRTTALSAIRMFGVLIYAILTYISGPIIEGSSTGNFFYLEGIFSLLVILPLAVLVYNFKE